MTTAAIIPARIAILCAPGSRSDGVGPDAIEALLTTWLKTPIALGHTEYGKPFLIGAAAKHVSLSHGQGVTAVAVADADAQIGIGSMLLVSRTSVLKRAHKVLGQKEMALLKELARDAQANAFGVLSAALEAHFNLFAGNAAERDVSGENSSPQRDWAHPLKADIDWRPWFPLAASSPVPVGLMLGMPSALLAREATGTASHMVVNSPNGPLALAVAWTPAR